MKQLQHVLILILVTAVIVCTSLVSLAGAGDTSLAAKNIHLGLDLAGGVSITYQAEEGSNPTSQEMSGALSVIQHRLDAKGYTEASAYLEGTERIRVEIPGVSDASQAVKEIGRTAMLRFVGIDLDAFLASDALDPIYDQYVQDVRAGYEETKARVEAEENTEESSDSAADNSNTTSIADLTDDQIREDAVYYFTNYPADALTRYPEALSAAIEAGYAREVVTGTNVENATYQRGQTSSNSGIQSYVKLEFDAEGKAMFSQGTSDFYGKPIIILLDDTIISMPTVGAVITDGTAIITGLKSEEEARNLASDIVGGALPVRLIDIDHTSVGATLGMNALETSIKAGVIGLIIIIVFLIAVYRVPGVMSSLALIFYVAAELLIINLLGWTLTLPGIAGFILSIGMAVDANVIIFSRVREEVLLGRTVRVAVKNGFSKALSAILDGNITTLIAAIVLYFFGTGTIKGFAQTLGLGIVLSMFSALVVTRILLTQIIPLLPDKPGLYTILKTKRKEA